MLKAVRKCRPAAVALDPTQLRIFSSTADGASERMDRHRSRFCSPSQPGEECLQLGESELVSSFTRPSPSSRILLPPPWTAFAIFVSGRLGVVVVRFAVKLVKSKLGGSVILRGRLNGWNLMSIVGVASADSLDILQPANLSPHMIAEMGKECSLLRNALMTSNIKKEQLSFLNEEWYINVLARIRINAFRIELPVGSYEDFLASAAASVEAEAAVGNAVYILPSFYNHDCDPNTHIVWIDNADAKLKPLRDIDQGEELRICYIDASMDHEARQKLLLGGFGFQCQCPRCLSGD